MMQHYGREIVAKELGLSEDHPDVERVYLAVYKSFMEVLEFLPIILFLVHTLKGETSSIDHLESNRLKQTRILSSWQVNPVRMLEIS